MRDGFVGQADRESIRGIFVTENDIINGNA